MTGPAVVVFCGPTIGAAEVTAHVAAACWPPAAQGDVLRALAHRPRAIAIVDGFFDRVPSVWHKEILFALSRGVHVFGASSMGALRAAELDRFGMVGVGEVYRRYRDGDLTDDDEVAVCHGPAETGYISLSTAMVDLRDLIARAEAAGAVSHPVAARLVALAKARHYGERDLSAVLDDAAGQGLPRR
jgi:hypothetical protein